MALSHKSGDGRGSLFPGGTYPTAAVTLILDARSAERFEGRAPEPRPALSSGHMPGPRCAPFTALTREDGRFRTVQELELFFAGIKEVGPVVTCGSGMTACVLALRLARLGIAPGSPVGRRLAECGFDVFERDDGMRPEGPNRLDDEGGVLR